MPTPKTFQDAESLYDRATKLEFAAEFKSAFRLYLEAANAFLQLSRATVVTPTFQAQCKEHASKAIQRAEKIKKASKTPGAKIGLVAAPIDCFGVEQQTYVLRKSSFVNNIRYPLWSDPVPLPLNPGTCYSDPDDQPTVPPSKTSITWQRPPHDPFACRETLTPADIEQNAIDDCSVCASVAICVQHDQKFNSKLLYSSLFRGNQLGRYDLKACLNGDCRRISIDDLLPYDETRHPMGISSGRNGGLWPALIEKAYMKLMGGYDFPGSNSSVDLRVLTGWIPEHIELQSSSFERERTWERMINGFQKGHCVLTVGTDAKTLLKIEGVKLLPSHDYATVDIWERDDERWLKLIDSRLSAANSLFDAVSNKDSGSCDPRSLDMRWDDICATFEGIYASWDPSLFQNGTKIHGVWKPANADDNAQASTHNLRLLYEYQNDSVGYGDSLDTRTDIWVLLTRHFSQTRREPEYISLTVHPGDDDDWRTIRVKMCDVEVKGQYTTSPHVLARTRVDSYPTLSPSGSLLPAKTSGALSILASYDGPFDDVFFTVDVFSGTDVKVRWDEPAGTENSERVGGFSTMVEGTLTTKNAGGNHTHPTYMLNPQWHLHIYDNNTNSNVKSPVALTAEGPREIPLNVTAIWSSGERIVELAQKEVAASSGAYTYGRAKTIADMAQAGDYTVVLSAFEPQSHLGQYTLKIESSCRFDFVSIPQEGAGMYTRVSKGEWVEQTAVGGPSHGRYHLNPIYVVQLSSGGQLSARLQLTSSAPCAALNLSLFPVFTLTGTPSLDRPLASSGPYSDAISGVYIPARVLSPGQYWLVPSTFAAGVHASFRLVVYCSDPGCVVSRRRL